MKFSFYAIHGLHGAFRNVTPRITENPYTCLLNRVTTYKAPFCLKFESGVLLVHPILDIGAIILPLESFYFIYLFIYLFFFFFVIFLEQPLIPVLVPSVVTK